MLEKGTVSNAYYELLKGRKLNTTIAYGVNDSNSSGTSYIMALTYVSKSKDLTKATATRSPTSRPICRRSRERRTASRPLT